MPKEPDQDRILIAQAAARLMAEHGIRDYALAKRKALRQLGLSPGHILPGNDEINRALREYSALFASPEQERRLSSLRQLALQAMDDLERFRPILVGGVANGAITEYSEVELLILGDQAKEFEQFLLREEIDYDSTDRNGIPIFTLHADPANVIVRLIPEAALRRSRQRRDEVHMTRQQLAKIVENELAQASVIPV